MEGDKMKKLTVEEFGSLASGRSTSGVAKNFLSKLTELKNSLKGTVQLVTVKELIGIDTVRRGVIYLARKNGFEIKITKTVPVKTSGGIERQAVVEMAVKF